MDLNFLNKKVDRETVLGVLLFESGILFSYFFYVFLHSTPLMAFGLSCIILGLTLIFVPSVHMPKKLIWTLLEDSCLNIEMLLEKYDARWRAIYLPPKEGHIYAYIPLTANQDYEEVSAAILTPTNILSGGDREHPHALMLFPPGSEIVRMAFPEEESDVTQALTYILVDFLEVAESIKTLSLGDKYIIDMSRTRMETRSPRFNLVLGSPLTSIIGCILARVLGKPVTLINEVLDGTKATVSFKVMEYSD